MDKAWARCPTRKACFDDSRGGRFPEQSVVGKRSISRLQPHAPCARADENTTVQRRRIRYMWYGKGDCCPDSSNAVTTIGGRGDVETRRE